MAFLVPQPTQEPVRLDASFVRVVTLARQITVLALAHSASDTPLSETYAQKHQLARTLTHLAVRTVGGKQVK